MTVATDEEAIQAAVGDYVEGWFYGDPARMTSALHPQLVKRCRGIEGEGIPTHRKAFGCGHDRRHGRDEDAADRRIEVRIEYLSGGIASVTCVCHRYADLLHLIRMPEGWGIVNAAWRSRELGPSSASQSGTKYVFAESRRSLLTSRTFAQAREAIGAGVASIYRCTFARG